MQLAVTFVSGPRRSGKSALIRTMLDRVWSQPPHYFRLIERGGDKERPKPICAPPAESGLASARWLEYEPDRVFEVLPAALTGIYRQSGPGAVIIEADSDPGLRNAYPYDHRLFVMPVPKNAQEVFRTPQAAAAELQKALEDTVSFASEIFGLLEDEVQDSGDVSEERPDLTATQMRGFLSSPLGDELATRIQLQPMYHGLVESDVVVINVNGTPPSPAAQLCIQRVERLFERLHHMTGRHTEVFLCDPRNFKNKACKKLLKALKPICTASAKRG